MLTFVPRSMVAPELVPTPEGMTLAAGKALNRSAVLSAPTLAKSVGLKLVTGTPTAAVPRINEPVIRTVSGMSSAWATSPCALASNAPAIVKTDAVPSRVARRTA